jgi:hypothetical protein
MELTRLRIDVMPSPEAGLEFVAPFGYIFRGVLLDWVDALDPALAARLHINQPAPIPELREYTITVDRLWWSAQGPVNTPPPMDPQFPRYYG